MIMKNTCFSQIKNTRNYHQLKKKQLKSKTGKDEMAVE